ncbi:hypothetical protein MP638_005496 [Amoeboaphelidium occidentale]|nr:hypothetical protein MP638_005496 [Amoeboaphelidium occidentale]
MSGSSITKSLQDSTFTSEEMEFMAMEELVAIIPKVKVGKISCLQGWLRDRLQDEKQKSTFSDLPFRYIEISKLLLEHAADDLPEAAELRSLLHDIQQHRSRKIRKGLKYINPHLIQMNNIGSMEINQVRTVFTRAMRMEHDFEISTATDGFNE